MGNLTHTVSGDVASFKSAARAPIESLKCYFEPVQEGSGDPSSDNVRPITGWDGITVYKAGKNLLNPKTNPIWNNNIYTVNDDNTITVKQSDGRGWVSAQIEPFKLKKGTYTFSWSGSPRVQFTTSEDDYQTVTIYTKFSFTFTLLTDGGIKWKHSGSSSDYPLIVTVQIEKNSEATEYEPYISKNIVKWNQWFKPLTAENWQPYSTSNISTEFENGIATSTWLTNGVGYGCSIRTKVGILQNNKEKWYISYMVKSSMAGGWWGAEYNGGLQQSSIINEEADTWYQCSLSDLYWKGTRNYAYISYYRSGIAEHTGMVAQIKAPIFVNLTQMFGAGNEPTKEEFEAQCALNGIDLTKELPYDEGSTIEWKTNGDLLKQEIIFPVLGKNKFNINSTYTEPSNIAYSGDTERIFQPYTYCVGLTNGNNYSPERVTEYSISNNTLTFTSRNTSFGVAFFIPLLYGTYRLSYTGENVNATIIRYDKNGKLTYSGSTMDAQGIFTVSKETNTLGIIFRATTADTPATVSNIQLEEGITVTEYEEFNPNHTVYGGYVDFAKGELVAEKVKHIITSDDFYVMSRAASTGGVYFYKKVTLNTSTAPGQWSAAKSNELYSHGSASNPYGDKSKNSGWIYKSSATGSTLRLGFTDEMNITTVEELYNWINNNNDEISIVYPLESPIHYSLTPSQLTTFLNYNNFWSNTNGQTEVSYAIHDSAPIRAAKHRIAANEPHIETISNSIVTFNSSLSAPLKSLRVNFAPIQEGSGDPSPTNVRPISGWTGLSAYHSGTNLLDIEQMSIGKWMNTSGEINNSGTGAVSQKIPVVSSSKIIISWSDTITLYSVIVAEYAEETFLVRQILWPSNTHKIGFNLSQNTSKIRIGINTNSSPITYDWLVGIDLLLAYDDQSDKYEPFDALSQYAASWQSEAGEVYGGYVDLVSGELVATWIKAEALWGEIRGTDVSSAGMVGGRLQFPYAVNRAVYTTNDAFCNVAFIWWNWASSTTTGHYYVDGSKCYISLPDGTPDDTLVQVAAKLTTPIHYQLTPQQIKILRGSNNIWSDAGNTTVKYWTH